MKSIKKIIAIGTSAAMLGITAAPAFAESEFSKDETVYVVTEADGSQNDVTVSDHLKNDGEADQIEDKTNLKEIENVKGDETFEQGEGGEIVWNAEGKDIFYDGVTNKKVPVQLGISYFLNGKEVQGSDMEGASGDVKIVINYRNTATTEDGTSIPFLAMTAFIAEDDCMKDVSVDQGKVIDDGEKKIVACMAVPGLNESLDLDPDLVDLDLEDTVTIKGKAKDFSVQDMMTVVTNSIFEDVDTDEFNDLDYDDEISELNKGSKQLMDGARQLYEGVDTLYQNMPKLEKGVSKLADGAQKLDSGTQQALEGSEKLDAGARELSGKLTAQMDDAVNATGQLQAGADTVLGGMKKIKQGLDGDNGAIDGLKKIRSGLDSADDGIGTIDSKLNTAKTANSDVEQYLEDLQKEFSKISSSDKAKLKAKGFDVSLIDKVGGKISEQKAVGSALSGVTGDDGLPKIQDGIENASDGTAAVIGDSSSGLTYAAGMLGAYDPTKQQQTTLIGAQTVISSGLTQLHDTLAKATGKDGELTKGLSSLLLGTESIKAGEVQLAGGSKQLADGMRQLQDESDTLSSGVTKLDQGSLKLSQGMNKLYREGIRKIVDLYHDDLKGSIDNLQDTLDAGQSYQSFTRLPKGMEGSVKFIYKTTIY